MFTASEENCLAYARMHVDRCRKAGIKVSPGWEDRAKQFAAEMSGKPARPGFQTATLLEGVISSGKTA